MTCSLCETELPDEATFCPRCGSPAYQSVATPVSPVPASPALQPQDVFQSVAQTTFSYLPAGAPPWPTTMPQELLSRPSSQAPVTENRAEAKPKRSLRGTLLVALLLVLVPVLGAVITLGTLYAKGQLGASAPPQPAVRLATSPTPVTVATATSAAQTNQLPIPTGFQKTSNPDVNVSFSYPADWIADAAQKSSTSAYLGVHPKQQLGITFIVARLSESTSSSIQSADEVNQANVSNISSFNVHDIQTVPAPGDQPMVSGVKWSENDATFVDANGNKTHFATLSVQHNKIYYNIVVFTPDLHYSEAMQKYINPILRSLQFLS